MQKQALLLIGSPKISHSTSESICNYLICFLKNRNFNTKKLNIPILINRKSGCDELLSAMKSADVIIFSSPLYIDCLPYPVIKFMEIATDYFRDVRNQKKQRVLAISNCGFPEAFQNDVALRIYKNFANANGFKWIGGLSLCMGVAISGRPMSLIGLIYRNIREAFELTADAIACEVAIPLKAVELLAKPLMPIWLYIWLGDKIVWFFEGLKHGVFKLREKPYVQ